jgi:hypothetical protein
MPSFLDGPQRKRHGNKILPVEYFLSSCFQTPASCLQLSKSAQPNLSQRLFFVLEKPVKIPDLNYNNFSGTDWLSPGELILPVGANSDGALNAWLKDILAPFHLNAAILNKLADSAQESASNNLRDEKTMEVEQLRFVVYISPDHKSNQTSWGFFLIEKRGVNEYLIECYLYVDGYR